MHGIIGRATPFLAVVLLAGCATNHASSDDPMAQKVTPLINATTRKATEEEAFAELASLGNDAVPYLVGHLGDTRKLPIKHLSLINTAPDAFEGIRHYGPEVVHDGLSAVLNQITGKSFEFVYNGSNAAERESDRKQWQNWCVGAYPEKSSVCRGGG
ncbi:hypothetical protein [Dyella japonica]|uniref:Lipoprotein n=1 Tax=Dyella japonica DSM 16301 TaxID=1440762 RepID=A0A0G9GZ33_9GAMM|nr:hypothetical protein [Dyella japonica]KLD62179.1 hypothetical protein Y882_17200 [Dyella japonica DSM 16301]